MFLQSEYNKPEKCQLTQAGSSAHWWAQSNPHGPHRAPFGKSVLEGPRSLGQNMFEEPLCARLEDALPAGLLQVPAWGTLSELQAASPEKMSLSPGMSWAWVLDSLSHLLSASWKGLGRPASRKRG